MKYNIWPTNALPSEWGRGEYQAPAKQARLKPYFILLLSVRPSSHKTTAISGKKGTVAKQHPWCSLYSHYYYHQTKRKAQTDAKTIPWPATWKAFRTKSSATKAKSFWIGETKRYSPISQLMISAVQFCSGNTKHCWQSTIIILLMHLGSYIKCQNLTPGKLQSIIVYSIQYSHNDGTAYEQYKAVLTYDLQLKYIPTYSALLSNAT